MSHRVQAHLPHRATIERRVEAESTDFGSTYTREVVASDVPCSFTDAETTFVRAETGERVERPATIRFPPHVDVNASDVVSVDSFTQEFEVQGVDEKRDHRRGRVTALVADVERLD